MEQDHLNARQSLDLISEIIIQTKDNFKQHSFVFLLWGWTLACASIIRFVLQTQTSFEYYFVPFPILTGIALIVTISFYRKNDGHVGAGQTHLNFFLKKLWSVLILGFIAIVFVSVYQHIEPFTYTLVLAAVGTIVSGQIMKFKPFILGGMSLLLAAVICVFLPDEFKVLVHGIAVIVGYIIPGYLLKNSTL